MQTFLHKIKVIFTDAAIRNRIPSFLEQSWLSVSWRQSRFQALDQNVLEQFFTNNQFLGLLNIFSGGGLSNLSIVMLGVGPFITSSIIMQLMTVMSPQLKSMYSEEGEAGRAKFTQWSRMIALPLAILQGFGFLTLLQSKGVITGLSSFEFIVT